MKNDLKKLYRELGYLGPLDDESRPRGQAAELPPLDPQGLRRLQELALDQPENFFDFFRHHYQYPLTDDQIRSTLSELQKAFKNPAAYVKKLRDERKTRPRGKRKEIPAEWQIHSDIKIDPYNHKFEPVGDALGWVVNSGYYFLRERLNMDFPQAAFRFHNDFPSRFKYEMKDRQGRPAAPEQKISVALFSDFGTGLDHSLYIARNIAGLQPDYAIHLGDVYYAGRSFEFKKYFDQPLAPVVQNARFFALNANHEMFCGAIPYFASLDARRKAKAGWMKQEQEGSYFCIRSEKYQLIGIDTAYEGHGRHSRPAVNAWLDECLQEGKSASPPRINILLSQNEPYELGSNKFSATYNDLKNFIDKNLIDFWFWGNTHYAALFKKTDEMPFVGSCIGHGGHPIYKKEVVKNMQQHETERGSRIPPALWVDDSPKFPDQHADDPDWKNPRPELGNHGFCLLELESNAVKLTYYDWLNKVMNDKHRFRI